MPAAVSKPLAYPTRRTGAYMSALVILLASLVSPLRLLGQEGAPGCDSTRTCVTNWVFRRNVDEVYVLFAATVKGKPVPDLAASDIKIRDDGKPPEKVLGFYTQDAVPVRLGILVDTSGSVHSRFRGEQAAAGAFLANVIRPRQDLAFVIGFSDIPELKQDFTNNPGKLWRGVTTLTDEEHNTALFDATVDGCQKLATHAEDHFVARVLIILSDGEENSSRRSLDEVIRAAQGYDVAIYSIWTHDPALESYGGKKELSKLARETGGRFLAPHSAEEAKSEFALLAQELHSRYAIAYRPADLNLDGRYRLVHINARKRGNKVHIQARKGYYAGSHTYLSSRQRQFTSFDDP